MRLKNPKTAYIIFIILSALCFIFSIVIEVQKLNNDASLNNICTAINPNSQCSIVQNSQYGKIFGLDNPFYGIIGFSILLIMSVLQIIDDKLFRRVIIILGSCIAGILGIWFLYVQKFLLKAYCTFCIFVDVMSLIMFAISIFLILYYIKNEGYK